MKDSRSDSISISSSDLCSEKAGSERCWRPLPHLTVVLVIAIAFAITAWDSAKYLGTHWDEQTDMQIVQSLLADPLRGSLIDPSQGRLPMYITALALGLTGPMEYESSLSLSRSLSIMAGATAILLTFLLARSWFGASTALLSSALLAISPYFLGFSRLALTEGDAFCAAAVLFVLLAFDRFHQRRDSPSIILLAIAIGIALASKFLLVCLFAPLILCDAIGGSTAAGAAVCASGGVSTKQTPWRIVAWSLAAMFLILLAMVISWLRETDLIVVYPSVGQWVFDANVALWAAGLGIVLVLIYDSLRKHPQHRLIIQAKECWPTWAAWLAIIPLSGVFCLALFPEHVFNIRVVLGFLGRLAAWDDHQPLSGLAPSTRLYAGVILFKLGLPLGVMTAAALFSAAWRSLHEFAPRVIICITTVFVAMLLTLPLYQTFYLMSIYPLLVIALSAFLIRVAVALPPGATRLAWTIAVTGAVGWLLLGTIRVYPAFGYYGYETIGARWMGRDTRGYRNIVQVTNDGTEEALRWCNEHVEEGRRVSILTTDPYIALAFASRTHPRYELTEAIRTGEESHHPDDTLDSADYLVLHHTRWLRYFEIPPEYSESGPFRIVHTVWRGRGAYSMPVVSIYERDHDRGDDSDTSGKAGCLKMLAPQRGL